MVKSNMTWRVMEQWEIHREGTKGTKKTTWIPKHWGVHREGTKDTKKTRERP
jgi:hypothetical protein